MWQREYIIKATHRGLWYEDGKLTRVLNAGRYVAPRWRWFWIWRRPRVEVALVDMRERDLTIKGQEILTADKVAIRVSIIVCFRVAEQEQAATTYDAHPALLRLKELETLREMSKLANARIYIGFDKHAAAGDDKPF